MKSMMILSTLILAINVSASELYTHCQVIGLNPNHEQVELYVSKQGALDSDKAFELHLSNKDGQPVEIKGLNVALTKKQLIDTFSKRNFGFGGMSTTFGNVYGVKMHVSALEEIGSEIQGCIPRPINEMDLYTICSEIKTIFGRQE